MEVKSHKTKSWIEFVIAFLKDRAVLLSFQFSRSLREQCSNCAHHHCLSLERHETWQPGQHKVFVYIERSATCYFLAIDWRWAAHENRRAQFSSRVCSVELQTTPWLLYLLLALKPDSNHKSWTTSRHTCSTVLLYLARPADGSCVHLQYQLYGLQIPFQLHHNEHTELLRAER